MNSNDKENNSTNSFIKKLTELGMDLYIEKPTFYYTDIKTAEIILSTNTVRISSPVTFNDPFELTEGLFDFRITHKLLREYFSKRWDKRTVDNVFRRNGIPNIIQAFKVSIEKMKNRSRVLCMSKSNDVTLMWSHYADRHRGVCLGFNFPPVYSKGDSTFFTLCVNYASEIQQKSIFAFDDEEIAMFYWIFTKSAVWSYEKEVRMFFFNESEILKNNNNDLCYDMPFDKMFLKEVHFGVATKKQEIDSIIKIVNDRNYRIDMISKMEINAGTFDIRGTNMPRMKHQISVSK